jgi:hypothetical protein
VAAWGPLPVQHLLHLLDRVRVELGSVDLSRVESVGDGQCAILTYWWEPRAHEEAVLTPLDVFGTAPAEASGGECDDQDEKCGEQDDVDDELGHG